MATGDITCVRCDRVQTPNQVVVVAKTKGATIYRCADEDECDEYQLRQKQGSTPGQAT